MKAVIVPGVTDLNKGDQALVWESWRLIQDTGLFDEVFILEGGDTDIEKTMMCGQSLDRGFKVMEGLLRHPRRGSQGAEGVVRDSKFQYLRLIKNGVADLVFSAFLLLVGDSSRIRRLFFGKRLVKALEKFDECDVIVVKGGGFIHSYGEFYAPYLMWYFLFYIRLGLRLNKKVVVLPNSFGPFRGFGVRQQVKSALKKCHVLYARENVSGLELSKVLGFDVPVSPDLGFYLKPGGSSFSLETLLEKYGLTRGDKIVGITVRPWRFPGFDNEELLYSEYISSMVGFVDYAASKGFKVVACNQSLGPNSHEDDRNAIKEVVNRTENLVWIDEDLSCDVLKLLYSSFYCLVGTRFHSVIFALTSGVPSLAIGYGGNKAQGIMQDFGIDDYVLPIESVTGEGLIRKFDLMLDNYDEICAHLDFAINDVMKRRRAIIDHIKLSLIKS